MNDIKHSASIAACIYFLRLHFVSTLDVIELNDPHDTNIAIKLVKYLDDKLKSLPHDVVQNEEIKETIGDGEKVVKFPDVNDFNMKKEDLNKVLVKRVVPHQMALTFEHDFGPYTDYRPIVRIHKKGITGGDGFNTASDKLQFLYFIRSKKQDRNDDVFNSDINLRNEQDKIQGLKNKNEFIRTILKNMQSNRLPYNKPVKVTDDMIKSNLLRNLNVEPPPGGMSAVPEAPKNIKWLPKYPFWNYWTYKKTIYQDECPGNQIAMGDLCVWVPPH